MSELDPEDAKLLTLARGARARAQAPQGAAVRDIDGRTYAAASVQFDALKLSSVEVAIALAASSGVRQLESVVVVGEELLNRALLDEVGRPTLHHFSE